MLIVTDADISLGLDEDIAILVHEHLYAIHRRIDLVAVTRHLSIGQDW